jgi:hypothetical protein
MIPIDTTVQDETVTGFEDILYYKTKPERRLPREQTALRLPSFYRPPSHNKFIDEADPFSV